MQARADHAAAGSTPSALRAVEDDAILEAIAMQHDAGLQKPTDGELRRTSWHMDFIYQLGGVSPGRGRALHVQFRNEEGNYDFSPPAMRVDGPVRIERDDLRRRIHVPARRSR